MKTIDEVRKTMRTITENFYVGDSTIAYNRKIWEKDYADKIKQELIAYRKELLDRLESSLKAERVCPVSFGTTFKVIDFEIIKQKIAEMKEEK